MRENSGKPFEARLACGMDTYMKVFAKGIMLFYNNV